MELYILSCLQTSQIPVLSGQVQRSVNNKSSPPDSVPFARRGHTESVNTSSQESDIKNHTSGSELIILPYFQYVETKTNLTSFPENFINSENKRGRRPVAHRFAEQIPKTIIMFVREKKLTIRFKTAARNFNTHKKASHREAYAMYIFIILKKASCI